jgi:rsbT co-antagonist protein RsbR
MTPFRVLTTLLALLTIVGLIAIGIAVAQRSLPDIAINGAGTIVILGILIAHLRGWRWSAHATLALLTLVITLSIPEDPQQHQLYLVNTLVPAILAIVLLPWYWSAGAFLISLIGILAQIGLPPIAADPGFALILVVMAIGCSLAAIVAHTAQQHAEDNATRAEEALEETRVQKLALEQKAAELAERNEHQQRLLDLVTTLETPAVALAEGVVLAPVVGHLDSRRAQALTTRLLHEVSNQRAQLVVIDIAGVAAVDTEVAQSLLRASQAVRLLGCKVIITGISASVATTLTHIGVNLGEVSTARTPQEALARYLESTVALAPYTSN